MKEFNFDGRSKFKVKWGGKEYICECPSQKELVEFGKGLEKVRDEADLIIKESKKFLSSCGLPPEVYDEMENSQLAELMDYIGAKKK